MALEEVQYADQQVGWGVGALVRGGGSARRRRRETALSRGGMGYQANTAVAGGLSCRSEAPPRRIKGSNAGVWTR